MEKIQTWLSDLRDWFYNIFSINNIVWRVETLHTITDINDEILGGVCGDIDTQAFQIGELYSRVAFLETLEKRRATKALVEAVEKTKSTKSPSKSKKAKEKKRQ